MVSAALTERTGVGVDAFIVGSLFGGRTHAPTRSSDDDNLACKVSGGHEVPLELDGTVFRFMPNGYGSLFRLSRTARTSMLPSRATT